MRLITAEEIDIPRMLRSKNPQLAARLPSVAMRGLELIAHQRELRSFIRDVQGCSGCEFVERALDRLEITAEIEGARNLPPSPRFVMCANHPTGGIDGLLLMQLLCRRYGGLRAPANDLLLGLTGLTELLIPINKYGSNRDRIATLVEGYSSPWPILVFPAGRTARTREYPWNKAFVKLARRSDRSIVAVGVSGRNSAHFYGIWKLRRALGFDVNLEMLLLMDELIRQRGSTRRVVIAPPVEPESDGSDRRFAQQLRRTTERLHRDGESPGRNGTQPDFPRERLSCL